ncbi:PP2C family protein-serine/threonine phosphatase [Streptomyces asoensis]|uniref:PP2C family protein-serine/threonine phosphatase n=1 Tax=Streptomyces TaxID=1883 RepID=UPI00190C06D9|nr:MULTISPECIES: PP2C family protein-serine/threonine phosphatase [unclassified Streptomyces]MBK3624022.1 serine/threonine-protein phosphatase [Streptomyces sp. MBT49]MBK3635253.1 serine/threonine-protein phosphatase [Streptomyces sp. MBT97]
MNASQPVPSAESQLRATAPHELVSTARRLLTDRVGAEEVTLLLADYALSVLQPVTHLPHTGEPVPAHDGPVGRAFVSQAPVVEVPDGSTPTHVVHLPLTVRGDRLGVLSVRLPEHATDPATVLRLTDFATALAHEVATAGRDTDLYLQARRTRRLTLAAEMQWQLLPGRGCARQEYVIGAHLEPAYTIGGDNFDWSTSADHLVLTVTDGMGQGIDASLLTSLAVGALRNARRAGIGLSDQACLADQALFAQYGGKMYASTLLLRFDLDSGTVHAVDAGSPQLYRQRGDTLEQIELEAQLPLGMFEETPYQEQTFHVEPGDRLIVVSSGVHGARAADGGSFGERALRQTLSATRLEHPHEAARAIVSGLMEHFGSRELAADAAVVCLDWIGRTSEA